MNRWRNFLCAITWHKWKYTDYKEHRYFISEMRSCTNCGQEEECLGANLTFDGTFVTKKGSLPDK